MEIYVNGEKRVCDEHTTIATIVDSLGISIMAVALNMVVVKRDVWSETELKDEDKLELLSFVGGG